MIPEDELLYYPHRRCLRILHRTEKERMSAPTIFYAENNLILAHTVKDVFELAGWRVDHCPSGMLAAATIETARPFDLLLLDNEIHFVTGMQLLRLARRLPHRQNLPVILMSIDDYEAEAREAGADMFLRKPGNIVELVDVVRRLLAVHIEPSTQE